MRPVDLCKPALSALISDVCKNRSQSRGSKLTLSFSQPGLNQGSIMSTSCGTYSYDYELRVWSVDRSIKRGQPS